MFEKLRKIKMQTAVLMGIVFYALTICIHLLIISGIIPFTWVNGGRSESFTAQLPISIVSITIAVVGGIFTLMVGSKKMLKYQRRVTVICWFLVVFWSFGFIQQLFGTTFEKLICSFILLLGIFSNLRIAIENDKGKG